MIHRCLIDGCIQIPVAYGSALNIQSAYSDYSDEYFHIVAYCHYHERVLKSLIFLGRYREISENEYTLLVVMRS